ncbi:MAG: cytidylate kinase family protein [Clostridia bacterium]|nr:cytidylate kinase family protein [Clostridia bacterium]
MHITITGKTGSGKTTISKLIQDELGYERYSTGEYQREIATKLGVDMVEMNEIMRDNLSYDHMIDSTVERVSRERAQDKLIFDSRMAWHFAVKSFKIFISIDPDVAGARVFENPRSEEPYTSAKEAAEQLIARSTAENLRFRTIYGVDNYDYANYDLIIDTTYSDVSDYMPIIREALAAYEASPETYRRRIYISPKSLRMPCKSGDDGDIVIAPYKGRHFVLAGHASVRAALEAGDKYVIADIPKTE